MMPTLFESIAFLSLFSPLLWAWVALAVYLALWASWGEG